MQKRRSLPWFLFVVSQLVVCFPPVVAAAPQTTYISVTALAQTRIGHDVLKTPDGVAIDPVTGNIYVSDTGHHQIKVITPAGAITVLAGSGHPGLKDGIGAAAELKAPKGLAFDRVRRVLYVADSENHTIRRVSLEGVVTRYAGSGNPGSREGAAAVAELKQPCGVAVDGDGVVYVADTANSVIRRVALDGTVTTVAGTGRDGLADGPATTARFARPEGIAVGSDGRVYIADTANNRIRVLDHGMVTSTVAPFNRPRGLAVEESGDLLVADSGNDAIRRVSSAGVVTTITLGVVLDEPSGIAVAGMLVIADTKQDAIRAAWPELQVADIAPGRGPIAGGTEVHIDGSGFVPGRTTVTIDGVDATNVTWLSASAITVTVPPHASGTVNVTVTTPAGSGTLASAYIYAAPPTIVSVNPTRGRTGGGEAATIRGTELAPGETEVLFGAAAASTVIVNDPTSASVTTPPGAAGLVDVTVRTPLGEATLPRAFLYQAPPTITGFSPARALPGTGVTIFGDHFGSSAQEIVVTFGAVAATITSVTDTAVVAVVPVHALDGYLTVSTAAGLATSAAPFSVVRLSRIDLSPSSIALDAGAAKEVSAAAIYTDGSVTPITMAAEWSSSDPTVATVDRGVVRGVNGGAAVITARFEGLQASAPVTVTTAEALPPDPSAFATPSDPTVVATLAEESAFLYSGSNPIQTGVPAGAIDPKRAAVLRGRVLSSQGTPLPGVIVSVAAHPELGQTPSRADGYYDIVVNGGAPLTLAYQKAGYITSHRLISTRWSMQRRVTDFVLLRYDSHSTSVVLGAASMQVARGSAVADASGARQATLLVPAGTTAVLVQPDGTEVPAATLTLRATEYTVGIRGPLAMPADLPPTTGYTYCVEVSADEAITAGAKEVRFSQPVPFYVENFLNFPVGATVPTGYYDRTTRAWMASLNGRVVKVLSIAGGLAQLDTNGDNAADDGVGLNLTITDEERRQLATLYAPGQTLWRVPLPHLTPWDCNWPYAPPDDAIAPGRPDPSGANGRAERPCRIPANSTVDCHNQTLGEEVPLVGTPFSLVYDTGRLGRARQDIDVDVSGATIPPSMARIELRIDVAGRTFDWTYAPQANLKQHFVWDGLDVYGRRVTGAREAEIRLSYIYRNVRYANASGFERAWAAVSAQPLGQVTDRMTYTVSQTWLMPLGQFDLEHTGFGGWSFSAQRFYDARGMVLYDGSVNRAADGQLTDRAMLGIVAGSGACCDDDGDGTNARKAKLGFPTFAAPAADGSIYFSQETRFIKRVDASGAIATVAGNGLSGFTPDGNLALGNPMQPWDVAVNADGVLYINDQLNFRVRRVVNGRLETVAGNGTNGRLSSVRVDGQRATAVPIVAEGIAIGPDGTLYLAEAARITAVGQDGVMRTVAGNGATGGGNTGDGGPAITALVSAYAIAVGADGSIYFADLRSSIRKISPDGIIRTFAGSPNTSAPPVADGALATAGRLINPSSLSVTSDGTLLVTEQNGSNRIRAIAPTGRITTLVGTGDLDKTLWTSGAFARKVGLNFPTDVKVAPDGSVVVIDKHNVVAKTAPIFPPSHEATAYLPSPDGRLAYVFAGGRHVRTIDALTRESVAVLEYDSHGYLTAVTDTFGHATRVERQSDGTPTAVVSPTGQRTTLTMKAGQLVAVAEPAGGTQQFSYDSDGFMTGRVDAEGAAYTFQFDADGRLVADNDPAGGTLALSRTGSDTDFAVTRTSALGRTNRYEVLRLTNRTEERRNIDASGLSNRLRLSDGFFSSERSDGVTLTVSESPDPRFGSRAPLRNGSIRLPSGASLSFTHTRTVALSDSRDPLSVVSIKDGMAINGRTFLNLYDVGSRTITTTSPAGRSAVVRLDATRRLRDLTVAGFAPLLFDHDSEGRLLSSSFGGRTTTFSYTDGANLESITDPMGERTTFGRDLNGRVTSTTFADGRTIGYGYDARGNITSITPPGRNAHSFAFTPVNLTSRYTAPSGSTTRYSYNKDRQLTLITRPDDTAIAFGYDTGGRLATVSLPNGSYLYGYSPAGKLSLVRDPDGGSLSFEYDGALITRATWAGEVSGTIQYAYDNDFRIVAENGAAYQYDGDGLVIAAGAMLLQRAPENGQLTGTSLGAVTDAYAYDVHGDITQYRCAVAGVEVLGISYERDGNGRITGVSETVQGSAATSVLEYDRGGRLARVKNGTAMMAEYQYDANGNRIAATTPTGSYTGTYDGDDRLMSYGGVTFQYGRSGELASRSVGGATTTYSYDAAGNLRQVNIPGRRIDYVIDGRNRRVGKKVDGVLNQAWLYADQLRIVAELDGTGAVVSRFVYGTRANVPDIMLRAGATYRIISDNVGSPRLVVNTADGSVAQRLEYDRFGRVTLDTRPGFQPFGFAGGLYDRDTEFVRFGARDYDAFVGRWTTPEPLRFAAGDTNFYVYAFNDPVNLIDPNGQWAGVDEVAGAAIGATVGTASYLVGHLIKYKSLRCVTKAEIAVVFGVGFVAGFFATDTLGGSVAVATTSNVVQYAGVQVVNGQEITGTGLVSNGVAGALGGVGSQALKGAEANTIESIARGQSRVNYPSSAIDTAIDESGRNFASGYIGNADPDCGCN